jgi:hypothetical protein
VELKLLFNLLVLGGLLVHFSLEANQVQHLSKEQLLRMMRLKPQEPEQQIIFEPEQTDSGVHATALPPEFVRTRAPLPENAEKPPEEQKEADREFLKTRLGNPTELGPLSGINNLGEVNYNAVGSANSNFFRNSAVKGNDNEVGPAPAPCTALNTKNSSGITYVQPSSPDMLGAVLFNGQACSGVKRRDGAFNNWPDGSLNGSTKMTPDEKHSSPSENFLHGVLGDNSDRLLKPIWLGEGGSVQIHSLSTLPGTASLAGISSLGCLIVNQVCMHAINTFMDTQQGKSPKFSIIPSKLENNACTDAVNLRPISKHNT